MIYFDPEHKSDEWFKKQMDLADAYIARKAEEGGEERRRAEEQSSQRHVQSKTPAEKRPWDKQMLPALPPTAGAPSQSTSHPTSSPRTPPSKKSIQGRKIASSIAKNLLKFGVGVVAAMVNAELQQGSPGGGGGGGYVGNSGGGYVGNSGGGAMDMSSLWAPIQSEASDPIQ